MLRDDINLISTCVKWHESEPVNEAWNRIKKALAELSKTPTNNDRAQSLCDSCEHDKENCYYYKVGCPRYFPDDDGTSGTKPVS